jgi:tRNA A-37 threonylcarbamoyl transferase component Bud32
MALQRLGRLMSHQEKPRLILVQKKIEGESLLDWIQKIKDPRQLAEKMTMVMKEMDVLHAQAKLSHGDMHPGNMILSPQGNRITFIDFERAKDLNSNKLTAFLYKSKDKSQAKDSFLRVVKDKHSPDIAKQVEKLFKSSS